MKKILITGAEGQLGKCIQDAALDFPEMDFVFASRSDFDITDSDAVSKYFNTNSIDYCINAAGYTQVDAAEKDADKAFSINAEALKTLSQACRDAGTVLMHISTDYVFDGKQRVPYTEGSLTNPLSVYGKSKLAGEEIIEESECNYFIIRTSWLYSKYEHNFLNTILRHAKEGKALTVTTEQTGTPTNANDLARAILDIIGIRSEAYGLYHFTNDGAATWYEFAEEILANSLDLEVTELAKTDHYPTFAERPVYSVLDTTKFKNTFGIATISWRKSLQRLLTNQY